MPGFADPLALLLIPLPLLALAAAAFLSRVRGRVDGPGGYRLPLLVWGADGGTSSASGFRRAARLASRAVFALAYAAAAEGRGLRVLIAAAGGAAHLAGVVASKTLLPVLGVPMESASLQGLDSLLSMVQMPAGIPVGTLAIGRAGAVNAALLAAAILAPSFPEIRAHLEAYREAQRQRVLAASDVEASGG